MSEFSVPVVKIEKSGKHPNADSLSITQVYGQNVIFRTGEFNDGDLAVYVPYDAIVPSSDPRFAFLDKSGKGKAIRIKPVRLRGVYSEGVLLKIEPGMTEGQDVSGLMGIEKYVEPETFSMNSEQESDPGFMPHYSLEPYLKNKDLLIDGEEVVASEKCHGSQSRFAFKDGRLWVGSHNTIRAFNENNLWWKVAIKYGLEDKLRQFDGVVFYGEVYGNGVQDLTYSVPKDESARLAVFDIYDTNTKSWFDHQNIVETCMFLDLPMVKIVYRGPLDRAKVEPLRTGMSLMDHKTIREGIVIRPIKDRKNPITGRTVLKLVSEEYKLRKSGTEHK